MFQRMTLFSKLLLAGVVVAVLFGAYHFMDTHGYLDKLVPAERQVESTKGTFKHDGSQAQSTAATVPHGDAKTVKVGVVTWGGYAGGEYFNEGFKASTKSRYYKDYGVKVEFVVIDDYSASRDAFKAGSIDVLWTTADSFPTEVESLKSLEPKIVFQSDWSRGGDAIVVNRNINSVADLKGKKVSVAYGTPSSTFLLWLLDAANLDWTDLGSEKPGPVQVASAQDSATMFKSRAVDAAVVWSPDDEDCVKSVPGAKILSNTRNASNIIADVFYVRDSYLQSHQNELKALVEGWLKGAAEINSSEEARNRAAQILADGLKVPKDYAKNAMGNARLTTYGDNVNFFNLNGNYGGVKGEDIYTTMSQAYAKINLAPAHVPSWRQVADTSVLSAIHLEGDANQAEGAVHFTNATEQSKTAPAIATKRVTITFPTGSAGLDENAKMIVQMKFGDIAKSFAHSRIRVEGNTDSTGSRATNKSLSFKRARAVADFLAQTYGFDPNRFVVVGNGPDKPVADNTSDEGRAKNRRTDFELIAE